MCNFKKTALVLTFMLGAAIILWNCTKKEEAKDPNQVAFDAANSAIGARLYDHVLNETDLHNDVAYSSKANFFRCKCCHGWDLLGTKGTLIGKTPGANYPEASAVNLYQWSKDHSIKEIFDAVKNSGGRGKTTYDKTMPDYGKMLTDAQIWDIVKWLKNDAHNIYDFADLKTTGTYPTGSFTFTNQGKGGDKVKGQQIYNNSCKGCHGADGTAINVYCQDEFLGGMFRGDVHEIQHKVKWGMPYDYDHASCKYAGKMDVFTNITDQDIRDLIAMGQDTVKFPGK